MLAQYYVFVYIPRTKVEALRKGPSRRDEVRDRAICRAKERGARYNVEAGGISKAWPHTPAHVYLPIGSRASIGVSASSSASKHKHLAFHICLDPRGGEELGSFLLDRKDTLRE